ncbi:MAG TPA: hypothetical protein VGY99_12970 [Candidatus Binataceae bacterium]|jgi:hypothetical protein|nr:hypothetical protein [Candidatus Binataceae bacterium]
MAEVFLLIVFAMLFAFAALMLRNEQAEKQAVQTAEDRRRLQKLLEQSEKQRSVLVEKNMDLEKNIPARDKFDDLFHELVLAKNRIAELEEERKALTANPQLLDEVQRDLAGVPGTTPADRIRALADRAKRADELTGALARSRLTLSEAENLAEKNAQLQRALDSSNGQTKNLETKLAKFSGGVDKKPCWADGNGKTQFIFNVALTSSGINIRDNHLSGRGDDEKALPLGNVTFGKVISDESFDSETAALFDWSEDHDCRFSVRVFDFTGADEKDLYKRRLQTVEGHFYKSIMQENQAWNAVASSAKFLTP